MDADPDGLLLQRILGVLILTLAALLAVCHAGIEMQEALLGTAESRIKVEPPAVVSIS